MIDLTIANILLINFFFSYFFLVQVVIFEENLNKSRPKIITPALHKGISRVRSIRTRQWTNWNKCQPMFSAEPKWKASSLPLPESSDPSIQLLFNKNWTKDIDTHNTNAIFIFYFNFWLKKLYIYISPKISTTSSGLQWKPYRPQPPQPQKISPPPHRQRLRRQPSRGGNTMFRDGTSTYWTSRSHTFCTVGLSAWPWFQSTPYACTLSKGFTSSRTV